MSTKNKYPLLVSCDWLEKNLNCPNLRIFDCTVWLKPQHNKIYKIISGKPDYEKEHIPNSDFLDVLELSDKNSKYDFMMQDLDLEILKSGGKLYLAKDSRQSPVFFKKTYLFWFFIFLFDCRFFYTWPFRCLYQLWHNTFLAFF